MNKIKYSVLCILSALTLSACGGDISEVSTPEVESQVYSQEDINSAVNIIKKEFQRNWAGCTLTEIRYAGDELTEKHQEWCDRNDADEVIVLLSSFDVDSSGGDGSLNPDSTYEDMKWILVRSNGEKWKYVAHGDF